MINFLIYNSFSSEGKMTKSYDMLQVSNMSKEELIAEFNKIYNDHKHSNTACSCADGVCDEHDDCPVHDCAKHNNKLQDHIENGNKLIAYMGAYCIYLKRLRKETVSTNEWKFVY